MNAQEARVLTNRTIDMRKKVEEERQREIDAQQVLFERKLPDYEATIYDEIMCKIREHTGFGSYKMEYSLQSTCKTSEEEWKIKAAYRVTERLQEEGYGVKENPNPSQMIRIMSGCGMYNKEFCIEVSW